jgi:putative chitinase
MFGRDTLRRLWPRAKPELINGIADAAPRVFAKYGCDDPAVVAIIMGQFSHECGAGLEMTESIAYTANRACAVWPSRFVDAADCYRKVGSYPGDPAFRVKLIDNVYGGRMGNRAGTHDGSNFIGRSPSQITGHDGYAAVARKVLLDLLGKPELANDPAYTLECAVADFVICGCLPYAKNGDIRGVTRKLNGGYIGLAQREQWTERWRVAIAADHGVEVDTIVPLPPERPAGVLQIGDKNFEVKAVQQQLALKGYPVGNDDGEFHEATRDAVLAVQANEGLPPTGIVDQATKTALQNATDRPVSEGRATASLEDLRDAGSRTVESADKVSFWGKLKMLGGGSLFAGAGAQQSGLLSLDGLQDKVEQGKQAYGVFDSAKGFLLPLLADPIALVVGGVVAVIGLVVWWEARKINAARLDDHRSAVNMAR